MHVHTTWKTHTVVFKHESKNVSVIITNCWLSFFKHTSIHVRVHVHEGIDGILHARSVAWLQLR